MDDDDRQCVLKEGLRIRDDILNMVENFDCHGIMCRECPLRSYKLCPSTKD